MSKIHVSFTKVGNNFVAEYAGNSGVLQIRHKTNALVDFFGDAGAGYMPIDIERGKNIILALSMAGLDKVKIISNEEVEECVVNQFNS